MMRTPRIILALPPRELERALGVRQAIEVVVDERLAGRPAEDIRRGHRDVVRQAQDVPHLVVAVVQVLEDGVALAQAELRKKILL